MFKKLMLPMFAVIAAVALAFGTGNQTKKEVLLDQAWFEYVGMDQTATELEKQTNYEKLGGIPSCDEGDLRCAIFAEIATVNGIEYPAVDGSNKVVFSSERKFKP